jgi:hypothetical protein
MANKRWLTQANRYIFANQGKKAAETILTPDSKGFGNTRVTIPSMQGRDGEAIAINQNFLMKPILETVSQDNQNFRVTSRLRGWTWRNPSDPDVWAWAIPRYDIQVNSITQDKQRIIPDTSPLRYQPADAANDRDWRPHRKTYQKSEFIKDFTKVFYDLATGNMGLDVDFQFDVDKYRTMTQNGTLQNAASAMDFLKIKPVFNVCALSTPARDLVTINRETQRSKLYEFLKRDKVRDKDFVLNQEDFDLYISNLLYDQGLQAQAQSRTMSYRGPNARRVVQFEPVFALNSTANFSQDWEQSTTNLLIWANPSNKYCFGTIDMVAAANNPSRHASRLKLTDRLTCQNAGKSYTLISPNIDLIGSGGLIKVPDQAGTVLCGVDDFAKNDTFVADTETATLEVNSDPDNQTDNRMAVPVRLKKYLTLAYNLPRQMMFVARGQRQTVKSNLIKGLNFFLQLSSIQQQRQLPYPYEARALSTCNKAASVVNCEVFDIWSEQQNRTTDLNIGLKRGEQYLIDNQLDTQYSRQVPVLYVRSSIIVSLDALAMNLRGQKFESLYEGQMKLGPEEYYQQPLVVKQNGAQGYTTFVEIILERAFDLKTYKNGALFNILNEIEAKLATERVGRQARRVLGV